MVGPPDALKLGGPCQPLAIALPTTTVDGNWRDQDRNGDARLTVPCHVHASSLICCGQPVDDLWITSAREQSTRADTRMGYAASIEGTGRLHHEKRPAGATPPTLFLRLPARLSGSTAFRQKSNILPHRGQRPLTRA